MNRQNTYLLQLNSGCEVSKMTNKSLRISLDKEKGYYLNFPSEVDELETTPSKIIGFYYDRMNSRLCNDVLMINVNRENLVDLKLRYGPVAFIVYSSNTPTNEYMLLNNYVSKILDALFENLLSKKCIERIDSIRTVIPPVIEPSWKEKLKIIFHNIVSKDKLEIPEERHTNIVIYPDMHNINFNIRMNHVIEKVNRSMSKEDLEIIYTMKSFVVFKIIDIYSSLDNEVQIVIDANFK